MPSTKNLAILVALGVAVLTAVLRRRSGGELNPQPEPPGLA